MDTKEFFFRLTPDKIFAALENTGLHPSGHWLQLNSMENRVFSIALDDQSHVVVKFYRPERWSAEQILEEHAFLFELADAEIPVCVPLSSGGTSLHIIDDIYYAVWPRTGGRQIDEYSDDDLLMLGRLLGRIHAVGKNGRAEKRPCFGAERSIYQALEFFETSGVIPAQVFSDYREAALEIADLYEEYAKDMPKHRIHGDCHPGNVLFSGESFYFLDFDDFLTGPAVQDFWMLLPPKSPTAKQAFLEGYALFQDFNPEWLRLVEVLRGMRFVNYAAWVARRREDPAFQAAFPNFGTVDYWRQEATDLVEQVQIAREELGETREYAPLETLENKDYFWDLE